MDQNTLGHKKTCHGRKGLISFNPLLFPDALDAPAEGVWTGCWTAKLFASQCKLEWPSLLKHMRCENYESNTLKNPGQWLVCARFCTEIAMRVS